MTASDSTRAVHHQIGQSLIELGPDGTTASAETYCTATTVNEADGQETWITFLVRYVGQFEKRDGSWKISHRFVAFDAVSDKAIMQYLPKANLGTRDE
ncbi:gamma-bhc dehydrochlorinase [Fusarium denticulatum]|uniref:Gamma-bhc dehydrochlorinase n=1 Tax=Fusarium denticulatum TaxID=48507 RepID=A0A8H5X5H5_9HYPO|nr:gamma-bhc dehydrochlorinase [Fusarium denticulatum]